jgi:hypothetical protein
MPPQLQFSKSFVERLLLLLGVGDCLLAVGGTAPMPFDAAENRQQQRCGRYPDRPQALCQRTSHGIW